jgi:hypothetical protein
MGLRQDLLDLYANGLDTERCATQAQGQYSAAINPGCAIVRRHSCAALAEAVDVCLKMHDQAKAERLSALASPGLRLCRPFGPSASPRGPELMAQEAKVRRRRAGHAFAPFQGTTQLKISEHFRLDASPKMR